MLRNLRSLFTRVKRNPPPRSRVRSPHEQIIALQRRITVLAEENLEQAGYIRFLTGKCVNFECDQLVRQVEKGELV